jgi:hypothetical protein
MVRVVREVLGFRSGRGEEVCWTDDREHAVAACSRHGSRGCLSSFAGRRVT